MSSFKKIVRTVITYLPGFDNFKAGLQRSVRNALRRPFDKDFAALSDLLAPGSHCIDVGGNRGQSIDALKLLGKSLRLTVFEPQSDLYQRLVKRYEKDPMVEVLPYGVSSAQQEMTLFVPFYRGYRFDGLASLDQEQPRSFLRNGIFGFKEKHLTMQRMPCELVTLDDVIEEDSRPVSFIKIDIEGEELSALQGAPRILREDQPILLIETPSQGVCDYLSDLGYRPYTYTNGRLVPDQRNSTNIYFLPKTGPTHNVRSASQPLGRG